jgi:hypothetical protein
MAWLQAKSQAKPSHTGQAKCCGLKLALAWPDNSKAKAKPASHGFEYIIYLLIICNGGTYPLPENVIV